jgi:HNH endonuclease
MSSRRPTRLQRKRLVRAAVLARYGCQCFYCDVPLSDEDVTMDHVIPESAGGLWTVKNLVPACTGCNRGKNVMGLEDFRAHMFARGRVRLAQLLAEVEDDVCWRPFERVLLALMHRIARRTTNKKFPGEMRSPPGDRPSGMTGTPRRNFAFA